MSHAFQQRAYRDQEANAYDKRFGLTARQELEDKEIVFNIKQKRIDMRKGSKARRNTSPAVPGGPKHLSDSDSGQDEEQDGLLL